MSSKLSAIVACVVALFAIAEPALTVEPRKPSSTAVGVAFWRAIGAKNPDPNFRNPDYLAEKFIGPMERAVAADNPVVHLDLLDMDYETAMKTYRERIGRFPTLMGGQLVRTRRIDELLQRAVERGARQVVILGAGFDSRAYRLNEQLRRCTVFEVDFPPTQEYKKRRIEEIYGPPPANVVFVPIDFNKEELGAVLEKAGYRRSEKSFFIWEGVTRYITEEAVDSTLRFISGNSAPASELVFTYIPARMLQGRQIGSSAEPWIFGIPDDGVAEYLALRGLRVESDLGKEEVERMYLTRGDGAKIDEVSSSHNICHASVPERAANR